MSKGIGYKTWMALLVALAWGPAMGYLYQQYQENRFVDRYIARHQLAAGEPGKAQAVAISQHLRAEFTVEEQRFEVLDMAARPFLREDTEFLLTHKEGLCGEGTRVLVNLLQRLGYDATRVTLYDRYLQSSHTLVSVQQDGREYWVDTINTRPWSNHFLNTRAISRQKFSLINYGDPGRRQKADLQRFKAAEAGYDAEQQRFYGRFWLYSYEALPLTKLLSKAGFEIRLFNHRRPPAFVSLLAEQPKLIMALVAAIAGLLAVGIAHLLGVSRWLHQWLFAGRGAYGEPRRPLAAGVKR